MSLGEQILLSNSTPTTSLPFISVTLFLFSEVLDEDTEKTPQIKDSDEISEVSDISEFSDDNEIIEDMDTPSYLRKGSNQ